jgi:hypothetical protein
MKGVAVVELVVVVEVVVVVGAVLLTTKLRVLFNAGGTVV